MRQERRSSQSSRIGLDGWDNQRDDHHHHLTHSSTLFIFSLSDLITPPSLTFSCFHHHLNHQHVSRCSIPFSLNMHLNELFLVECQLEAQAQEMEWRARENNTQPKYLCTFQRKSKNTDLIARAFAKILTEATTESIMSTEILYTDKQTASSELPAKMPMNL